MQELQRDLKKLKTYHHEPVVFEKESFWVLGFCYSGATNKGEELLKLWNLFNQRNEEIPHKIAPGTMLGVFFSTPEQKKQGAFTYIAGAPVETVREIPFGMTAHLVRGGKFALLTHSGPVSELSQSFSYLFNEWLPASSFSVDDRESFELYDERFKLEAEDSEFDVCTAIRES